MAAPRQAMQDLRVGDFAMPDLAVPRTPMPDLFSLGGGATGMPDMTTGIGFFSGLQASLQNLKYTVQRQKEELEQKAQQAAGGKSLPPQMGGVQPGDPFLASVMPMALAAETRTGFPAVLAAAIAANETGRGRVVHGNSYHGIRGQGPAGSTPGGFRAYPSAEGSFQDVADLITTSPRYAPAWQRYQQTHDVRQLLADVANAGYASSQIIERNGRTEAANWIDQVGSLITLAEAAQASSASAATRSAAPASGSRPQQVLAQAQQWIAANPRYAMEPGATNRQVADCSGFIVGVMRELGMPFGPGIRDAESIRRASVPIPADQAQPGDLVFFHSTYGNRGPGWASHVGIVQQNGIMIDTGGSAPLGPRSYNTPAWSQKFLEVRRPPQYYEGYGR